MGGGGGKGSVGWCQVSHSPIAMEDETDTSLSGFEKIWTFFLYPLSFIYSFSSFFLSFFRVFLFRFEGRGWR